MRDCEVRTGPGADAYVHRARVGFLAGSATWAFMLLHAELFAPRTLVRPIAASAGPSAWTTEHPSWCDDVGPGGASHPSFAALTLAREATICDALTPVATALSLAVVPMGVAVGIDGTGAAKTPGRADLTVLYGRIMWLAYARLHEERAYNLLAIVQISKLSSAASADSEVAAVMRPALMQEILRACQREGASAIRDHAPRRSQARAGRPVPSSSHSRRGRNRLRLRVRWRRQGLQQVPVHVCSPPRPRRRWVLCRRRHVSRRG